MAAIPYLVMLLQSILLLWPVKASATELLCPLSCGDVRISYPFGIGEGCYFDKGFEVTCDNTSVPPKPYLSSLRLEISQIFYYPSYMVRVNISESQAANIWKSGSPFSLSNRLNMFLAVDCDDWINSNASECQSFCTCNPSLYDNCCDFLCTLAPNDKFDPAHTPDKFFPRISDHCRNNFVVDQTWLQSNFLKNLSVLKSQNQIPAGLEWGKYKGSCTELFDSANTFCNEDNYCLIKLSPGHVCVCDNRRSDSNQGCTGDLICTTTSGNNCSRCPHGYYGSYALNYFYSSSYAYFQETRCYKIEIIQKSRVKFFIIIGCSAGLGTLLLLIGLWWSYKFVKRRKAIKLKQRFFKRNGGLLLQQQLSANEGNIEKTRLFTSKELGKATDNYNTNRILGQGGQGTVYKGMLADGRIVAIKKSKIVDESKVAEFINEMVILSQINHRNVVQLLGCCLETEVPLLVYEFISNGTLFQYIHDQNEEFPLTWEVRLRIATEVANAVSYLHSAASMPIYHRDIKSTNVLLDEKYQAKVSDFGTSRSVTVDHTHLTTQVQGTFGYVDPEYFQSSQFSEKSDVYSFGVVLAELLTGQKPIRSDFGDRSLAKYFLRAMEENCLVEILDARVLKEDVKEGIMMVANITRRCLNLNGKKRPTMREVAIQLAANIKESSGASGLGFLQNHEEMDSVKGEIPCNLETGSSSNTTSDVYPLISKKC